MTSKSEIFKLIEGSTLNESILETKRYTRHKDNCRRLINEFIVNNYFYRSKNYELEQMVDFKTGDREPVFYFMCCTLTLYYKNLCIDAICKYSNSFEDLKKTRSYTQSLLASTYKNCYSFIEKYIDTVVKNNIDDFVNACNEHIEKVNNLYKEHKEQFIDEKSHPTDDFSLYKKIKDSLDSSEGEYLTKLLCDKDIVFEKYLDDFIDGYLYSDNGLDVLELFNKCFDNLFYKYIRLSSFLKELNINNYVTLTKFENDSILYQFFVELFEMFKIECENVMTKIFIDRLSEISTKEAIDKYKEEHEFLKIKAKEAEELFEKTKKESDLAHRKLDDSISIINNTLSSKKALEKSLLYQISEVSKNNKDLSRELQELQAKYEDLSKYLQDILNNNEDTNTLEEEIIVDTSKNYIFISGKDTEHMGVIKDIIAEFPNAIIKDSNFNIQANSTDLVIFLTSFLEHSVYYDIKNQCKGKSIPYVHCHTRNIKDVKKVIRDYLK